ncbi:hypothetical protein LAZ67_19002142 [Cordylochernes scorpioides]|uniref:Uncharacterized protein n=1 Tax=Cordylochernes scorpioides TaxID=51811 RepID=A0ABY6LI91_9ARAC|nr:hypothetical protein LAZ67_19002142 [Cordylochernes scorpioides]
MHWSLGRITKVFPGADGKVRVVETALAPTEWAEDEERENQLSEIFEQCNDVTFQSPLYEEDIIRGNTTFVVLCRNGRNYLLEELSPARGNKVPFPNFYSEMFLFQNPAVNGAHEELCRNVG